MKLSSRSVVALAAALTLGLAGCGSDDSTAEDTADSGGDLCTQLENISNFEMESQTSATVDPSDWPGMQQVLSAYGDGLSENYDPAIESADADIAADLTTVRDASMQVSNLVTESTSFEDYQAKTQASLDEATYTAARDASSRIDTYALDNCAFAQELQQQQQEQQQQAPALEPQPAPEPQPGG